MGRPRVPPLTEQVIARARAGARIEELAHLHGCSTVTVRKLMKQAGVPYGRKRKHRDWLYLLGNMPDREIAKRVGLSHERIRQIRVREGIASVPRASKWLGYEYGGVKVIGSRRYRCKCGNEGFMANRPPKMCMACLTAKRRKLYTGVRMPGTRLTGIRQIEGTSNTRWLWKCDCGNETEATVSNIKSGLTKSCGCLRQEYYNNRRNYQGVGNVDCQTADHLGLDQDLPHRERLPAHLP